MGVLADGEMRGKKAAFAWFCPSLAWPLPVGPSTTGSLRPKKFSKFFLVVGVSVASSKISNLTCLSSTPPRALICCSATRVADCSA